MIPLHLITASEFQRVRGAALPRHDKLALLADMCRANTLTSVKRAGSGHLGSSFSAMDIVVWLYHEELNTLRVGLNSPERDIYFSSKGHDVPGQYAVLYSLGVLPQDQFLKLRRLNGTCGHPDVSTPGMEANTGSLGMGISKGKGIAFAKRLQGHSGHVYVMTGDGEFQEGQIWEALQSTVHQRLTNLTVIIDHNKVQSDKPVAEILDLGNLDTKLRAFGWSVHRCDGHDYRQLEATFAQMRQVTDQPKILVADTIKGRGVSFMEHPAALKAGQGLYRWHSGAPDEESFRRGFDEIIERVNARLRTHGLAPVELKLLPEEVKSSSVVSREYVAEAFGQALVEIAAHRQDIVVLDADLAADCRIRACEQAFPDRFIENGIAEQDMVSMAGGLARQGLLPVVNTFASFLAARANEQIYNNACERTKIIYVCHYAGLIPAGPGQSHQSIRDISLFGALPDVTILQPCNAAETRMAVEYCITESSTTCVLRLIIGPSPRLVTLPSGYLLTPGRGVALASGNDAVLFAYGPVMLHEALVASESLAKKGLGLRVINMPWLNRVALSWLEPAVGTCRHIYVLEDHAPIGGLADCLLNALTDSEHLGQRCFTKLAVEGLPAWGAPPEVLRHHSLDGASIARRVRSDLAATGLSNS